MQKKTPPKKKKKKKQQQKNKPILTLTQIHKQAPPLSSFLLWFSNPKEPAARLHVTLLTRSMPTHVHLHQSWVDLLCWCTTGQQFVGWCWLTSQQHASGISGTDLLNFTCCHTDIEVADQTFHLTQSQYTDTGSTSPSADPITPGAWQGSHWSVKF